MGQDITIRGAGIFGLAIAWACTRRGAQVTVVDPGGIGAGASGGLVGALAPHVPDPWDEVRQAQFEALVMAPDWWGAVADAGGLDPLYARTGRLQPLADPAAVGRARDRAQAAARHWGEAARWEVVPVPDGPWSVAAPTGLVIRDTLSARIAPRAALAALAAAIRAGGGRIVTDAPDTGPTVWAAGAADLVSSDLGTGIKGQAALLAHDARDQPQIYAQSLHIVPHGDGTVAIGSTTERDFADPAQTDTQLDALIARARALVPALADAPVIARWAGLRPRTPSRVAILGPHPARPGALIANGGFKIGFGLAPWVAEVMADLILNGQDRIPPAFRP